MNGDDVDEQLHEDLLSILLNGDIKRFWSRWGDGSSVSRYITEVNVDELLQSNCVGNEICDAKLEIIEPLIKYQNIEDEENIDWLIPQPHRAPHRPYYWLIVGKFMEGHF